MQVLSLAGLPFPHLKYLHIQETELTPRHVSSSVPGARDAKMRHLGPHLGPQSQGVKVKDNLMWKHVPAKASDVE